MLNQNYTDMDSNLGVKRDKKNLTTENDLFDHNQVGNTTLLQEKYFKFNTGSPVSFLLYLMVLLVSS